MKKIIVGIVFCLVVLSQNVFAETNLYWATEGVELTFALYPGDTALVLFEPGETGRWDFTAWHTNMMSWDKVAAVSYYWGYLPDGDYTNWANDAAGYTYVMRAETEFASGQSNVGYYAEIKPLGNNEYMLPMHVEIFYTGPY